MIDEFKKERMLSIEALNSNYFPIEAFQNDLLSFKSDKNSLLKFYSQLSGWMNIFHEVHHISEILSSENYDDISPEGLKTGFYLLDTMVLFKRILVHYYLLSGKKNSIKAELGAARTDECFIDFLNLLKCKFKRKLLLLEVTPELSIHLPSVKPHIYRNELDYFVKQMLKKRYEIRSNVENSDIDLFNQQLCDFNDLLKDAHYLFSASLTLKWRPNIDFRSTPKYIKLISLEDKNNYSSYLMITKPNNIDLHEEKKRKWLETSPSNTYYQITLNELISKEKQPLLRNWQIDNFTKVYIDGHCGVGASYIMDDEENIIHYKELAKSLNKQLSEEQRTLLQEPSSHQYLTIRVLGCSAGKGNEIDSEDSFAAKLHRELKEKFGIYTTIIANTRTTYFNSNPSDMRIARSFILNTKYGYDENLVNKHLKDTSPTINYTKKSRKAWSVLNSSLVSKQPGSKVIFKWNDEGQQIRECALKGGEWRIKVYDAIINLIDQASSSTKIENYNQLLADLHELDEDEMLTKLNDILENPHTARLYGIKNKSSLVSPFFHQRKNIYLTLKELVEEQTLKLDSNIKI